MALAEETHERLAPAFVVDAGGKLPQVIDFIDTVENVDRVMPKLKEMTGRRLIVRQPVAVESRPS